jgi:hypothetical protein
MALACNGVDCQEVTKRQELQKLMGSSVVEGYRQGYEGPAQDGLIVNQPWGFELHEIPQHFNVWQGEIGEVDQNNKLIEPEGTAHLFPYTRWEDILVKLIGEDDATREKDPMPREFSGYLYVTRIIILTFSSTWQSYRCNNYTFIT